MRPIDVLIVAVGSYHLSIMTSILVGHLADSKPLSFFNLNVSHLESPDFCALVHSIWNLVPRPQVVEVGYCGGKCLFVVL